MCVLQRQRNACPVHGFGDLALRGRPKVEHRRLEVFVRQEAGQRHTEQIPFWAGRKILETKFADADCVRIFFWVAEVFVMNHVRATVALEKAEYRERVEEFQALVKVFVGEQIVV